LFGLREALPEVAAGGQQPVPVAGGYVLVGHTERLPPSKYDFSSCILARNPALPSVNSQETTKP
jgi:hypothetical protein